MDAGPVNSLTLPEIGPPGACRGHSANPTTIQDVFVRIGGAGPGKATTGMVVDNRHTIVDHTWIWRADHGDGVGRETNRADHGVVVGGDDVTTHEAGGLGSHCACNHDPTIVQHHGFAAPNTPGVKFHERNAPGSLGGSR